MKSNAFDSLSETEFAPLSEVKAKLSEKIRLASGKGKKIAITSNGKPAAILLGYRDYLTLLQSLPQTQPNPPKETLSLNSWKKDAKKREEISRDIDRLFIPAKLSRKGKNPYKQRKLREFSS